MARPSSYTDAEKTEALALYATEGPSAVQRTLGIPKSNVTRWAKAAGIETFRNETPRAAIEAHCADIEARKARVGARLWQIADEASEMELRKLATADLRSVVGARTRAIHDAQLLAGAATSRHEVLADRTTEAEAELAKVLQLRVVA